MKAHLQYLWYVLRHKWFVLVAGLKTGAPLWRLLIHDWSKFTPAEWTPYVNQFYAKGRKQPGAFEKAWMHHWHHNAHHWQHWLDIKYDGTLRPQPMPDKLVREMVADWMGAGRAITGSWDIEPWYEANKDKMILFSTTRTRVEWQIAIVTRKGRAHS
jgi:hypothetical protein